MLKTVLDHQKTTVKSEGSVCCAEVGSVCAEYPSSASGLVTIIFSIFIGFRQRFGPKTD